MDEKPAPERLVALRKRAGLTRAQLAKLTGFSGPTSIQNYETLERWADRLFPLEFVAKLAAALVGKGEPSITEAEVWALAEPREAVTASLSTVVAIPLFGWPMNSDDVLVRPSPPIGAVYAPPPVLGTPRAFLVPDSHCAALAPKGASLTVDLDERTPKDGGNYLVEIDGQCRVLHYKVNPERWESFAFPPAPTLYPRGPIVVIGRVFYVTTRC